MADTRDMIDGCALDFTESPTTDEELQELLIPTRTLLGAARSLLARSTRFDTDLANRLRRDGLDPIEVPGWKSRGYSGFSPKGAVTHHTAGASRSAGAAPSLGIIVNGRSDLSGPLANVYIDYENRVYVVAAGKANHAGLPDKGRPSWMTGNGSAYGLEVEHPGTFPLPPKTAEIAARVQAAIARGQFDQRNVVYHKEWAPSRKIDLATAPSPAAHRITVAKFLKNPGQEGEVNPQATWFPAWKRHYILKQHGIDTPVPPGVPSVIPQWAWDDVGLTMEIHKLLGPPDVWQKWTHARLLGNPVPDVSGLWSKAGGKVGPPWWAGAVTEHQFALAFDALDDAALEKLTNDQKKEIVTLKAEVERLMTELAAEQSDDNSDSSRIAELESSLAAVRQQLLAIVDEIK